MTYIELGNSRKESFKKKYLKSLPITFENYLKQQQTALCFLLNSFLFAFVFFQIFQDLVRQINKKNPEQKSKKKKKSPCSIL